MDAKISNELPLAAKMSDKAHALREIVNNFYTFCLYRTNMDSSNQLLKFLSSIKFAIIIVYYIFLSCRIKFQYEAILEELPTMRNAKHDYIDCCQGIEGFGCRFFKLKVALIHKLQRVYTSFISVSS